MTSGFSRRLMAVAVAVLLAVSSSAASALQDNADALYQEARRLFEALDYDKAVVALDQAVAALQTGTSADAARRERLGMAYEMRARSRFGLGDQDGAKADFVLLLKLSPLHALAGQVSPRVVALFEQTAKETVTNLTVAVTPATATLSIDGVPAAATGTMRIAIGEHVIAADQAGYRPAKQTVLAVADTPAEVTLALERVSSVIRIITTPADVEVKVDGAVVGRTAAAAGAAAEAASLPLVVSDVVTGSHTVELTRGCFVTVTERVAVERPDDYAVGPVTLVPAIATLTVSADQAGAQVFVDGRDRGVAPTKVTELCEGEHLVEWRTPFGADSRRVAIRALNDLTVEGVLKPTFAIVSTSGAAATSSQDYRVIVQRAFAGARTVTLLAPAADLADTALKANQLPMDWLAMDATGRPVGASAQIAGPSRKEVSARLSEAFKSQGVASVTAIDASRVIVSLLSAGSTAPDAIEVALDNPASIAAAVAQLDRRTSLSGPSLGLQVIDVADVVGALIVGIDPRGPAAAATAKIADIVWQADGKPVADAAALAGIVAAHKAGDSITLDVRDAAGAAKRVELKVGPSPRVIGLFEHGLLANRLLLDLRARLVEATDPVDQSVIRLNIAVALARLGDWTAAREELQRVKLPDRNGVGNGTVQYLLGLAAESLGNRAEADTAFKAAAESDGWLTENGPSVKELAAAKLVELQKTVR
ncbi:MAG: PEGA domain-containing protein [Vicinamibacterales bacterium]